MSDLEAVTPAARTSTRGARPRSRLCTKRTARRSTSSLSCCSFAFSGQDRQPSPRAGVRLRAAAVQSVIVYWPAARSPLRAHVQLTPACVPRQRGPPSSACYNQTRFAWLGIASRAVSTLRADVNEACGGRLPRPPSPRARALLQESS